MLTNLKLTFSTYLKINTNLAATTMNPDPFGTNNQFDSFTTTHQDELVFESEDDEYQGNSKYNDVEKEKPGDTVTNELFSPVQQYITKYNQGKQVPKTTGYVSPSSSSHHNGPYLPTDPKKEPPKQQKFKTSARKVKPRITPTTPSSKNSSIIASNQSNVTQSFT